GTGERSSRRPTLLHRELNQPRRYFSCHEMSYSCGSEVASGRWIRPIVNVVIVFYRSIYPAADNMFGLNVLAGDAQAHELGERQFGQTLRRIRPCATDADRDALLRPTNFKFIFGCNRNDRNHRPLDRRIVPPLPLAP